MLFLDRVTIEPTGGPWKRGYLRGEQDITPDLWFFDGHFHNDPCMPGTLMFEACVQAMQLYLTTLGYTLDRDGWRFEPAKGETFKLRCRGQVTPTSKKLVYELYIQSVTSGPVPKLRAQVMCTIDGLKCFHADPLTVELVPDWPMTRMPALLAEARATDAREAAEFQSRGEPAPAFGIYSLLACAWGRPSEAFGPMYAPFDGPRKVPRLPGPPYHFLSRVTRTIGDIGSIKAGTGCVVEYDVPPDAWYFRDNPSKVMPFAVLLEAALQPCGWLASWTGCILTEPWKPGTDARSRPEDMLFRNLDGKGHLHADVHPDAGTLSTEVKLTRVDKSGGMVIVAFTLKMTQAGRPIYDLDTVFGFFPPAAFANQAGVPSTPEDRAWVGAAGNLDVDLRARPARYFGGPLRMAEGDLLMLDRVTHHEPTGGPAGIGKWRGEKKVDPVEWMFKAHFYSDPVQPGSLGIEAMIQLLQLHCIHAGMGAGMAHPRFEGLGTGATMIWRYRGQVIPEAKLVQTELEIVEQGANEVRANAHLWVDGKRIYSAKDLRMRVVDGPPPRPLLTETAPATSPSPAPSASTSTAPSASPVAASSPVARPTPSAEGAAWLRVPAPRDHCPTYVIPALPMMTMAMLTLQAGGASTLRDGQALRWCLFPGGAPDLALHVQRTGELVTLAPGKRHGDHLTPGDPVFRAKVGGNAPAPGEPPALLDASPGPRGAELYASGELFHGPTFQVVDRVVARGRNGATLRLKAGAPAADGLPAPLAPDLMLDGATHGIPHDHLDRWDPSIPAGVVGYPMTLRWLWLGTRVARGPIRCEVRHLGTSGTKRPRFGAWFYDEADQELIAAFELEEVLLPKGRLGDAPPALRRDFLLGHHAPGVSLARLEGDRATLSSAKAAESDWLPGTLLRVYGADQARSIAAKELVAARVGVHPRFIELEPVANGYWAHDAHRPLTTWPLTVAGDSVKLDPAAVRGQDLDGMVRWWRQSLQCGAWAGEDLLLALARYALGDLVIADPEGFRALRGTPCLYLANHENYVESVVFCAVMAALGDLWVDAVAKVEHRDAWLGGLHGLLMAHPTVRFPGFIRYFDQADPAALPRLVRTEASRSLLVHVEGTRQTTSGAPVEKISSLWADVAIERGLPIVPVAFRGGLPKAGGAKVDLPVTAQRVTVGPAISPTDLAALPYADRRKAIAQAINALDPQPLAPSAAPAPWNDLEPTRGIGAAVKAWIGEQKGRGGSFLGLASGAALPPTPEGEWVKAFGAFTGLP